MTRSLYQTILWLHPPAFRRRFRDEMLCIFDEAGARYSGLTLLQDGLVSLTRQWLLRKDSWKILVALCGAFVQVWGLGFRTRGHQSWAENQQALTPYMEELMLITIALVCSLLGMIIALTVWMARFQRRRR